MENSPRFVDAGLSMARLTRAGVVGGELPFLGKVGLDRVDEDELFAAAALVIEPAPFELAVVTEVVDGLDAAGDEGGGFGDANPGGWAVHAQADFAIDRGGKHFEEPLLLENGGGHTGELPVCGWLAGAAHRGGIKVKTGAGGDSSSVHLGLGWPARAHSQVISIALRRSGYGGGLIGSGKDRVFGPSAWVRRKKLKSAISGLSLRRDFGVLCHEPI